MAKQKKTSVQKNTKTERRYPQKYLTENSGLPPGLLLLLKNKDVTIMYFEVIDGLLFVYKENDRSECYEIQMKILLPFLAPSKYLMVEKAYVVNKSLISDLKEFQCGWMLYLGHIKIPMWTKLKKTVEKLKIENAARQYLKSLFATRQPNIQSGISKEKQ